MKNDIDVPSPLRKWGRACGRNSDPIGSGFGLSSNLQSPQVLY